MLDWRRQMCVAFEQLSLTIIWSILASKFNLGTTPRSQPRASSVNLRIHRFHLFLKGRKRWKSKDADSSTMSSGKRSWSTIRTIKKQLTNGCIQTKRYQKKIAMVFFSLLFPTVFTHSKGEKRAAPDSLQAPLHLEQTSEPYSAGSYGYP